MRPINLLFEAAISEGQIGLRRSSAAPTKGVSMTRTGEKQYRTCEESSPALRWTTNQRPLRTALLFQRGSWLGAGLMGGLERTQARKGHTKVVRGCGDNEQQGNI